LLLLLLVLLLVFIIDNVLGYWQLTFSDEFNSQSKVNTTKWNTFYRHSPAIINSELEYYSPDAFKSTATTLKIAGEKRGVQINQYGKFDYTSGVITTSHKFSQTYGYYELNAKVPTGLGFWPAWWLLPENSDSDGAQEIDIMEMIMNQPNTVYTTFHCNYSTGGGMGKGTPITNFDTNAFHRFGLQWLPGWLIWYVDGVQVFNFSSACVPNKPVYLLANLAIGGSWPAPPTAATVFPSYFEIDYIRVYKYSSASGVSIGGPGLGISYTPIADETPQFKLSNPVTSPETVAPGAKVTVSVDVTTDATAYTNIVIQFLFYNSTFQSIGAATINPVSIPAYSTKTISSSFTIPTTVPNGFVTHAFGAWTANWASNFAWETTMGVVGVNKVVGQTDHL